MKGSLLRAVLAAESRGARGRVLFVGLCLGLGVASISALASIRGAVEDGLDERARALLGADLSLESRRAWPLDLEDTLQRVLAGAPALGLSGPTRRAEMIELDTMVARVARAGTPQEAQDARGAASALAELKAVPAEWPLAGELSLDPPLAAADLGDARAALAPELCASLGVAPGDRVAIGGADFTVAARVLAEPDELDLSLRLGPRILIGRAGLERTGLLAFGSRVRRSLGIAFEAPPPAPKLERLARALREELSSSAPWVRVSTSRRAQPLLRNALDRSERALGLVALLSLVLGGLGVAQIVRGWIVERVPSIAVLRALGFRPRDVTLVFLAHVAQLALTASAAGAFLGSLAPLALARAAPDFLGPDVAGMLRPVQPAAFARALALGLGCALFFALEPLLAVRRVRAARVLRATVEPLPLAPGLRLVTLVAPALGVFLAALWLSGSARDAVRVCAALGASAALLALAGRGLARVARRASRWTRPPWLAHGLAALARPGGQRSALLALGLGVLAVCAVELVQRRLSNELAGALPPDAPTVFLLDVQDDQWPTLQRALAEGGAEHVDSVPVVSARLAALDGRRVDAPGRTRAESSAQPGTDGRPRGERWALTREQRLTWRDALPADNRVVAGALWSDPEHAEVSLEEGYARDLGVELGARLTFDVQGVEMEFVVTSLRRVEWRTFRINFFILVEPGALDGVPCTRLASARLAAEREDALQSDVVARAPNVTFLRVRATLERVSVLFARLARALQVLAATLFVTGLAILAGVCAAAAMERRREVALLKTLGLTRAGVARLFAVEFALAGAVAGALGAAGAWALAWLFLSRTLELEPRLPWIVFPVASVATALGATAAGLAASAAALRAPPARVLGS